MPVDRHAQRFLDMMAAAGTGGGAALPVAARRAAFARLMALSGKGPPVGPVEDLALPGPGDAIPLRVYRPPAGEGAPLPALVWFHGGGMVAGSLDTHDALCRTLCAGAGVAVLSVGYRLAPEHPFPAAVDDAIAATGRVFADAAQLGIDPGRIAVGGDSAGGTLATVVCLAAAAQGGPAIACQLLLCPVLDFVEPSASRRELASGYLLDAATLAADFAAYGSPDPGDPRVSPLRAVDLRGMPPTVIHTAGFDPLRDEGAAWAARLAEAGVDVAHTCHAGLIHHFYGLTGVIPAARTALDGICRELAAALGTVRA